MITKEHLSNIQILAEILKEAQSIPFSSSRVEQKAMVKSDRPSTVNESENRLRTILTQSENDNFDELEELQHRILSQNIKQGMK